MKVYVVREFEGHYEWLIEIFENEEDAIDFVEDFNNGEFYSNLSYKEWEIK